MCEGIMYFVVSHVSNIICAASNSDMVLLNYTLVAWCLFVLQCLNNSEILLQGTAIR